jgi:hypothetical protein
LPLVILTGNARAQRVAPGAAHNPRVNDRRRAGLVLVAVGLVLTSLVVIGVLAIGQLRRDEVPPEVTVQRPAPGEARADHLADGTPIWVIGHEDRTVTVLSGFDTHVPSVRKLLWWCPGARTLEDPRHGSRWTESGARLTGPAPAPLHTWQTAPRGSRLVVGDPQPATDEPANEPIGLHCIGEDPVTFHEFHDWDVWTSPRAAAVAGPIGWFLVDGRLVPQPDGTVWLCALAGCDDSVQADWIRAPEPDVLALDPWPDTRYLAQARHGRLIDLAQIIRREDLRPDG